VRAEHVVAQDAAVFVGFLVFRGRGPEGRGFDDFLAEHHVHQLEAAADDAGAAKQRADLLGRGIGGHVEVLGFQADDQVTDGAADDIGFIAMLAQYLAHLDGVARHVAPVDAVLVASDATNGPRAAGANSRPTIFYGFGDHLGLGIYDVVEQVDHLPAAFLGDLAQGRAGVGGDRTGHLFEQRDIIDRIAIEKTIRKKSASPNPMAPSQSFTRTTLPP